jgi:hypothetical protein
MLVKLPNGAFINTDHIALLDFSADALTLFIVLSGSGDHHKLTGDSALALITAIEGLNKHPHRKYMDLSLVCELDKQVMEIE